MSIISQTTPLAAKLHPLLTCSHAFTNDIKYIPTYKTVQSTYTGAASYNKSH